jgi:arylsulfatase A-like enzyme
VPLLARGAGFPAGAEVHAQVASVDIAPTIAALAGAEPLVAQDGRSLLPLAQDPPSDDADPRAMLLENGPSTTNLPHYDGVRVDGWVYVEWETGELELYDLREDPSQLESLHTSLEHAEVREQLAALLGQLRSCVGSECDAFASVSRP